MDAFSEVLSGVKLKGALFFSAEFSAPWAFAAPRSTEMVSTLAPGAPHLVIYHLVVDGVARAALPDGHTLTLEPGDIVVFPHGDAHEPVKGAALHSVLKYWDIKGSALDWLGRCASIQSRRIARKEQSAASSHVHT